MSATILLNKYLISDYYARYGSRILGHHSEQNMESALWLLKQHSVELP